MCGQTKVASQLDGKWIVYANDFSGETLQTTANSQADGWDKEQDYLAGIKPEKAAAPTSTRTSARHKDRPIKSHARPERQSNKCVGGPGRKIHDRVKSVSDAKEGLQNDIDGVLSLGDDSFGVILLWRTNIFGWAG